MERRRKGESGVIVCMGERGRESERVRRKEEREKTASERVCL